MAGAGARLRAVRQEAGLSQAALARRLDISASYLALIEAGRRPLPPRILAAAAATLGVAPAQLTARPDPRLVQALALSAARSRLALDPVPFAEASPDWARVIADQAARIAGLERSLGALRDPAAHDRGLDAALHEVVSSVTAVAAAGAILAGEEDPGAAWRARFRRNLAEDAARLSAGMADVVARLSGRGVPGAGDVAVGGLEAWRLQRLHGGTAGEAGTADDAANEPGGADEARGAPVAPLGRDWLARDWDARLRTDAARVPDRALATVAGAVPDPAAIARSTGADIPAVLRRLAAAMPDRDACACVICDASGTPLLRRAASAFPLSLTEPPCPLWPLFDALRQPGRALRRRVAMAGATQTCLVFAAAEHVGPSRFDAPPRIEAVMLAIPEPDAALPADTGPIHVVGSSCRLCPAVDCPARREAPLSGIASPTPRAAIVARPYRQRDGPAP